MKNHSFCREQNLGCSRPDAWRADPLLRFVMYLITWHHYAEVAAVISLFPQIVVSAYPIFNLQHVAPHHKSVVILGLPLQSRLGLPKDIPVSDSAKYSCMNLSARPLLSKAEFPEDIN